MVSSPFWEKTLHHHFDRSGHFGLKLVHSPEKLLAAVTHRLNNAVLPFHPAVAE